MSCTLIFRGGEVSLHPSEKYNKVRQRINKAIAQFVDYQNGNIDPEGTEKGQTKIFQPVHLLSFKTVTYDDNDEIESVGRIAINPEHVIGVLSDEEKDGPGGGDDEDDAEDE